MGLAGRAHNLLFSRTAVLVVGHDFQFAGFIGHVHPHQAVATLQPQSILFLQRKRCFRIQFTLLSVALPVDEEFGFGVAGVDKDGGVLPFPARPGPVGQHVQGVVALVPQATVEVVAVLGQAGQVDDAEHGAMAGPCVGVVRRRFAQVVEARPHELAERPVVVVGQGEVLVGHVRPRAGLQVVARALVIVVHGLFLQLGGELVDAARADGGRRFGTQHQVLGQLAVGLHVAVRAVVEAGHVEHGGKAIAQDARHLVHAAGDGACGVFAMADVLQERGHLVAFGAALGGHFVADAPHHHAGVVAILAEHVHHILLRPLVEEAVVAVLTLGNVPLVERLEHHHETHLVTELHQLGRRHIVGGADGIATHVLEQRQLAAEGTQRAEVVMVAHALELAVLAVEEEALVGHQLDASDAEAGDVLVHLTAVHVYLRRGLI